MFKFRFTFTLATILCLAMPVTGLAAPAGAEPIEHLAGATADHPGPAGTMSPLFEDEVDRIVRAAIGKALPLLAAVPAAQDVAPRVVYLQAPAAAVSQPPGTVLGMSFEQLVALLATVLVPLLLGLGTLLWKGNASAKEAKIAQWIRAAYLITEEVSKLTPNTVDDKIAYALLILNDRLQAAGINASPAIRDQARATWTAMSGAEKVEASVRAKAGLAVAAAGPAAGPQTPLAGS